MRYAAALPVLLALFLVPRGAAAQDPQAALWDASIAGDTAAIRAAVAAGADINAIDIRTSRNGRRALNWAALNDHAAAITLLLQLGAELEGENYTGFTALHHAAEAGSVNAARTLLDAGSDPERETVAGYLPMAIALHQGHFGVVDLLAEATRAD